MGGKNNCRRAEPIALVKVNYENFKENYTRQKQFQNNSARESGNVAQYRNDADALILEVWNEVERYFEGVKDEEEKRYMCEEYGLVYVFRRGEKERIRRRKEAESITLKLFSGLRAQLSFKGQVSQVLHDSSFFKAFSFL